MTYAINDNVQRDMPEGCVETAINDACEHFGALVDTIRSRLAYLRDVANSGVNGTDTLQWYEQTDDADQDHELDAFARDFAIAAYNNRDNAIWNPLDPRTYRTVPDEESVFLQHLSKAPGRSNDVHRNLHDAPLVNESTDAGASVAIADNDEATPIDGFAVVTSEPAQT